MLVAFWVMAAAVLAAGAVVIAVAASRPHARRVAAQRRVRLTISVWDAMTTLGWDGTSGVTDFEAVDVPLDEAADLADQLLGGPAVHITPRPWLVRDMTGHGIMVCEWRLHVRAFILEEAWDAVDEVLLLLLGRLDELQDRLPRTYRFQLGELVPQSSSSPSSGTGANGS